MEEKKIDIKEIFRVIDSSSLKEKDEEKIRQERLKSINEESERENLRLRNEQITQDAYKRYKANQHLRSLNEKSKIPNEELIKGGGEVYVESQHPENLDKVTKKIRFAELRKIFINNIKKISKSNIGLGAIMVMAIGIGGLSGHFVSKSNKSIVDYNKMQKQAIVKKVVNINGSIEYVDSLYGVGNLSSMVKKVYGLEKNIDIVRKVNEVVEYNAEKNPDKFVRSTIVQDGEFVDGNFVNYPEGYDGLRGDFIFRDRRYLFPNRRDTTITLDVVVDKEDKVLDDSGKVINNSLDSYIKEEAEKSGFKEYNLNKSAYNTLDQNRKKENVIKYSSAFLSGSEDKEYLMNNIVNTYINGKTIKESLETIKNKFGVKMSKTSLYRVCDKYGDVVGYTGKIRKTYLKA